MNRRYLATAPLTATLLLIGSDSSAVDDRSRHPRLGNPMPIASAAVTRFSPPAPWDISISVGKRGGHPDYGYRSYGYRSNRCDSDGNYHYKGGRHRYWYPCGRGHGYGFGHRHRY